MRAKTLNLAASYYTKLEISSNRAHSAIVRLTYDEVTGFSVSEAYVAVSAKIPLGSVAENFKLISEVVDDWYNAEINAYNGISFYDDVDPEPSITATGYVSIIRNYHYSYEFSLVQSAVKKMTTRRASRAGEVATEMPGCFAPSPI